jgi:hypothetical protein
VPWGLLPHRIGNELVRPWGAFIFGEAVGATLVAGIVFALTAKGTKNPVWLGVPFAALIGVLLMQHGREILETYDARRFQSELSSADQGDRGKALANSSTQMAALLRQANALGEQTNSKISAIFIEIDDPALVDVLDAQHLNDPAAIDQAKELATEKITLARTAMQRIDAVLADDTQEAKKIVDGFSDSTANPFLKASKNATLAIAPTTSVGTSYCWGPWKNWLPR